MGSRIDSIKMQGLLLTSATLLTLWFQLGNSRELNFIKPDPRLNFQGCSGCHNLTDSSPITGTQTANPSSIGTKKSCPPSYPCTMGRNKNSSTLRCCSLTFRGRCADRNS